MFEYAILYAVIFITTLAVVTDQKAVNTKREAFASVMFCTFSTVTIAVVAHFTQVGATYIQGFFS